MAVSLAGIDVFLAFRYATLEAARTRLLDMAEDTPRISLTERFSLITSYLHACAAVVWLLLWQLGPLCLRPLRGGPAKRACLP